MKRSDVVVRAEKPEDILAVRHVNISAFDRNSEADLVDLLRGVCPDFVSLVAVSEDQVVGHILFTPVTIQSGGNNKTVSGIGLAPMSVLPEFQGRGIGPQVVKAGLDRIEEAGHPFVVVLGKPDYYQSFGFVPASRYGIACEYENIPDEAFMILVFDDSALEGVSGTAKYRPEFRAAL